MTNERAADHSRATVRDRWGDDPPDWIVALADACDRAGSQSLVARLIGKSPAAVSQVLKNRYGAGLGRIETAVRAHIIRERVACPGQGSESITKAECLAWQGRPFAATNPQRVRMFKACRSGCPHSALEETHED